MTDTRNEAPLPRPLPEVPPALENAGNPPPQRRETASGGCRCPDCGARYPANGGGHCRGGAYGGCCRTFTGDTAAGKHRTGPYNPHRARRCLTDAELLDAGWRETPRGWTDSAPMPKGVRR